MRYDFPLIIELCSELGLVAESRPPEHLALRFERDLALIFQNAEIEDNCLIGFEGTPWHFHDELGCVDRHGYHVDLDYLDVITGIANGSVLVAELWTKGELEDRWLVHQDYVDEFRYMREHDEVRIRRLQPESAEEAG